MAYEFYEYEHKVTTYETDFKGEMKPSAVLNHFQEAAGCNSFEMGIDTGALRPQGKFWVLSKMYVVFDKPLHHKDVIKIKTWPHKPNKAIFERSFQITHNESVVARAISRWCILDINTQRILPASQIIHKQDNLIETRVVECDDWRILGIEDKKEPDFSICIYHSEYDLNYHVNNVKYIDYVLNCFSVKELTDNRIKSLQINFVKQSHEKDVLDFYKKPVGENKYIIEGVKNHNETVVLANVIFQ